MGNSIDQQADLLSAWQGRMRTLADETPDQDAADTTSELLAQLRVVADELARPPRDPRDYALLSAPIETEQALGVVREGNTGAAKSAADISLEQLARDEIEELIYDARLALSSLARDAKVELKSVAAQVKTELGASVIDAIASFLNEAKAAIRADVAQTVASFANEATTRLDSVATESQGLIAAGTKAHEAWLGQIQANATATHALAHDSTAELSAGAIDAITLALNETKTAIKTDVAQSVASLTSEATTVLGAVARESRGLIAAGTTAHEAWLGEMQANAKASQESEKTRVRADDDAALERAIGMLSVLESLDDVIQSLAGQTDDVSQSRLARFEREARAMARLVELDEIAATGNADEERHEVVSSVDGGEAAPGTIVEVLQRGYSFRGRVVRRAQVVTIA